MAKTKQKKSLLFPKRPQVSGVYWASSWSINWVKILPADGQSSRWTDSGPLDMMWTPGENSLLAPQRGDEVDLFIFGVVIVLIYCVFFWNPSWVKLCLKRWFSWSQKSRAEDAKSQFAPKFREHLVQFAPYCSYPCHQTENGRPKF